MDTLGKNVFINAAMRNNQKMSPEAFVSKWKRIFDPKGGTQNTEQVFKKVNSFTKIDKNNRDDIGLLLWNELSTAQPISPLAMPKAYHDNPNGRMFWMLQSFTLKVLDIGRKDVLWKAANGDHAGAAKAFMSLAGYFILMNGTVDAAKDFVRGKEQLGVMDRVVDNSLRMLGVNKFMIDSAVRQGAGKAVAGLVMPPTTILDDPFRVLKGGGVLDRMLP
jgi:hypothetical protein